MTEDSDEVLRKSWARIIEPVAKAGYMDGAADGQTAAFQESFDTGYQQGLIFGLELGLREAITTCKQRKTSSEHNLEDPRRINCQICTNAVQLQENIGNLYNIQQEKNLEYLSK